MEFNAKDYHVIEMVKTERRPKCKMGGEIPEGEEQEKSFGSDNSRFLVTGQHINTILRDSYRVLRNIKTPFSYMDKL